MEYYLMTNRDNRFYVLMGPFLSRRKIVNEIGGNIWDDDNKEWIIAVDNKNIVAGFGAILKKGQIAYLCSAYVIPKYRHMGLYRILLSRRIARCYELNMKIIKVTATEKAKKELSKTFHFNKKYGKFYKYEREIMQ